MSNTDTAPKLLHQLYRYRDLEAMKIATSRAQLHYMIKRNGFPTGFLISDNARAWRAEEIEQWLASRPTAPQEPRGNAKALKEGTAQPPRRAKKGAA